jgi:hypothetical protein
MKYIKTYEKKYSVEDLLLSIEYRNYGQFIDIIANTSFSQEELDMALYESINIITVPIIFCKKLIKKGADVNFVNNRHYDTDSLLMIASFSQADIKKMKLLIENGANLWYKNNKGKDFYDYITEPNVKEKINKILPKEFLEYKEMQKDVEKYNL